jgi:hypothetical protein
MKKSLSHPYYAIHHVKQGNALPKKMRLYCIENGWLTEDGKSVTEKGEQYLTYIERQSFCFPPKS